LRFPRAGTAYIPNGDPDAKHDGAAPKRHVWQTAKDARARVV
jgi:hypothetical protein